MRTVNVHAAKTNLSSLLEEVAMGREVIIAKAGTPVAKLVPYVAPVTRVPGGLRGQIQIHEDFDAPLPDEMADAFGSGQ